MTSGLAAVVIADDLTGGADTGVHFAAIGSPFYLLPLETLAAAPPWLAGAGGLSLYTESRHLSASAAALRLHRAARAVSAWQPRLVYKLVYKKIDSCLRGNLGAEIDALLAALDLDAALIAPALPAQGRTTIDGVHRVHGRPLAETELAQDPVAPVGSSVVADVLATQSRHGCGRLGLGDYGDPGRLRAALGREQARGCRLIVCDAVLQGHLDQLAELVDTSRGRLLPVGSAGLGASLAARLAARLGTSLGTSLAATTAPMPEAGPVASQPAGRVVSPPVNIGAEPASRSRSETGDRPGLERLLLVCGTASPVTRRQLDVLLQGHPGVRRALPPSWLADATGPERRACAMEILAGWTRGPLALAVQAASAGGRAAGPARLVPRLVRGLAALAADIVRAGRVDALVLTGGETAEAFRLACEGHAIALERELLPGLVLGRWQGGLAHGLPVVTKAGAFGGDETLHLLYRLLSPRVGRRPSAAPAGGEPQGDDRRQ